MTQYNSLRLRLSSLILNMLHFVSWEINVWNVTSEVRNQMQTRVDAEYIVYSKQVGSQNIRDT